MSQGSGKRGLFLIGFGVLVGSCHGLLTSCPQDSFFNRIGGMMENSLQLPKTVTLVKVDSLQSNPVPSTFEMECVEKITLVDIMDEAVKKGFKYALVATGGASARVTMIGGQFRRGATQYWEVTDGTTDITNSVLTEYVPAHGANITFTLKSLAPPVQPGITTAAPEIATGSVGTGGGFGGLGGGVAPVPAGTGGSVGGSGGAVAPVPAGTGGSVGGSGGAVAPVPAGTGGGFGGSGGAVAPVPAGTGVGGFIGGPGVAPVPA